ncbi:signal peptidase I [Candidatus Parcubacteria bacterium]|nr:signal peptidase I [Candidatus Parcubacteria bacterium]
MTDELVPQNTPVKKEKGFFREIFEFTVIALVIIVPFRLFIAQPYLVNGASMDPSFETGDYLIVDQLSYRFEKPARGSVIIFKYPNNPSVYFIKRVIGLPNETVVINGSQITIKDTAHPEGFVLDEPYVESRASDTINVTLGTDEYFVMGDNRAASSDSRAWGPLKAKFITGRPVVRLTPLNKIGILPGNHTFSE